MNNQYYHIIFRYFVLVLVSSFCFSCSEDDSDTTNQFQVLSLVSLGPSSSLNGGLPNELIRVEGIGIADMDKIKLDNNFDIVFNPALNSDQALFFNVPVYDEEEGSRFGEQELLFTKKNGESLTFMFNVIQPAPRINSNNTFEPERAEVNDKLLVRGEWFFNVESVSVGDIVIDDFEVISDREISFVFPEGFTESPDLIITTAGGSITTQVPIKGGLVTYLLTDFDGSGVIEGGWVGYGDHKFQLGPGLGNNNSNGGELIWDNTGTDEFTGCTSEQSFIPVTTSTDPKNTFVVIDINILHPGTVLEFTLTDSQSNQWLAKPPSPQETGWQTVEFPVSIFGDSFTPDSLDQSDVDPDPATIVKVNVQISQEGDAAPIPSGYQFDNIRLKVLEL